MDPHSNTTEYINCIDSLENIEEDIMKVKKFSNVKLTAANQSLFDVAEAFSPLMKSIYRSSKN